MTAGTRALLDRDRSLHPHREVGRAMIRILARLHVRERNGVVLVRVHEHGTRQLAHLIWHVGHELRLDVGRHRRWVERDVVWAAGDHGELDAVAGLDRDVSGLEAKALFVAHHLLFMRSARDRRRGASWGGWGRYSWGGRVRRRRSGRVGLRIATTAARTKKNRTAHDRKSEK